jgi:hypothetical protein
MSKKLSRSEFIERAHTKHESRYVYDKVKYVNIDTNITITCKNHGDFRQSPYVHLIGCGCPKCGGVSRKNTNLFTDEANLVHNHKYDYSKTEYYGNKKK